MRNWRRFTIAGAVVFALAAMLGGAQYLSAVPDDTPSRAASSQGSHIPNELAIDQRQGAFLGGQNYMAIMNSELTDTYTEKGWRGSGRSMNPNMGYPSYTFPAGGFDSPLWASAFGITAYLPEAAAAHPQDTEAVGSFVGTWNVYRNPAQKPLVEPQGFWSDLGGSGSPGMSRGTVGPGGYREPFITETRFLMNNGIEVQRQSYSFSYGYGHTNDFILMRHVLYTTGAVDTNFDGTPEFTGKTIKNFFAVFNYDYDITVTMNPNSRGLLPGGGGGDDKQPPAMFVELMPKAVTVPGGFPNSGRYDVAPFGPRFYSGLVTMFDEDDPNVDGIDAYVWNERRGNFNPLHLGQASLMVFEGAGDGPMGDLDAVAALDIYEAPSVGLFTAHEWWKSDLRGVFDWYRGSMTKYLKDYKINVGDQTLDQTGQQPHPDLFVSGSPLDEDTDISTWTAKTQAGQSAAGMGLLWGDPRNLTQPGNRGLTAGVGLQKGKYDYITLNDLDGVFAGIVPDPYEGSDTKDETSESGCIRNMIGWGPYTTEPGENISIWEVDLVGAGKDGAFDVYLRAMDVWMQRKYNKANDTYYWDGSNERIIPMYNSDGSIMRDGDGNALTETIALGRSADSGALFHPPPAPTLSVFPTSFGTIAVAWTNNAETAVDPGTGTIDFAKYRIYRASGFINQFPDATAAVPTGYNSTIVPPSMGLSDGAAPVIDVTDPTALAVKQGHPYGRFIHEGLTIGADYNIGRVYSFVSPRLINNFAAPNFSGPYVQIAEFGGGGSDQTNTFSPPELVRYPNPLNPEERIPGFTDDNIETKPSSTQIVEFNNELGANTAFATSFSDRYPDSIGSGDGQITTIGGIVTDPRLVGKSGYIFEDRSVKIGFAYWYYVAAVDNESAVQLDFDNFAQSRGASSKDIATRTINGLESFYTMNANGTDGRWHGQFPARGLGVGPQTPGQEVIATVPPANAASGGKAVFQDEVIVSPNPFVYQADWDLVTGSQSVKFFNLPIPARITIFDVSGAQVRQFQVPDSRETTTVGGVTDWDLKNNRNLPVSSGLYICVIEAEIDGQDYAKTLKLYVRR